MIDEQNSDVIVTLYEGHYHYGVASLINSLIGTGFKGLVRVGYRGEMPVWVNQLDKISEYDYYVTKDIILSLVTVSTDMHFGYYKPNFMLDTLQSYPTVRRIFYFDPDITVNAPWNFFVSWVQAGVALCLDNCFHFVHRNHLWRKEWIALAGVEPDFECTIDYYINSGFVGLEKADAAILHRWVLITEKYQKIGGNITVFEKDGHRAFKGDQDLLNAVLTVSQDIKFSIIGKEGMGFSYPAYLMNHAVSSVKPWKKNFIKDIFIQGQAPELADKNYLKFSNFPIKPYGKAQFNYKKLDLLIASALGRVFG